MQPLVSIVIPIYNSGQTLADCLDSIICQTYTNLDIILVDDGSSDNSLTICEQYKSKDKRVVVLSQANAGSAVARASGLKHCKGEWICFVDSDDTIPENSVEILVSNASDGSDIIVGFAFETDGTVHKMPINKWRYSIVRSDIILCTPWGKLFRNGIISPQLCMPLSSNRVAEDMIMNIRVSYKTNRDVTIVNKKVYNYIRRCDSLSASTKWDFNCLSGLYADVEESIPEQDVENMSNALIENRLAHLKMVFMNDNFNRLSSPEVVSFFDKLRSDVKMAHFELSPLQYLAVYKPFSSVTPFLYRMAFRLTVAKEYFRRRLSGK